MDLQQDQDSQRREKNYAGSEPSTRRPVHTVSKLVKSIFGGNPRDRDRDRESKSKEIATVSEYIKFMPNLFDFIS
jgi:hypothetical protein